MAIPFLGCYKANQTANIILGPGRRGLARAGMMRQVWHAMARLRGCGVERPDRRGIAGSVRHGHDG